jgi:hypothetical protein
VVGDDGIRGMLGMWWLVWCGWLWLVWGEGVNLFLVVSVALIVKYTYICGMRTKGTIYPKIDKLPPTAKAVSIFAEENGMQVGHVYMKYKRFHSGQSKSDPLYTIRCYQGMNFVIPTHES